MTVTGGEDDRQALERALIPKGIRVAKGMADRNPEDPARDVLKIDGFCGEFRWTPSLSIEGFDLESGDRVFAAHLGNKDGCPDTFFAEVADALDRDWAKSRPHPGGNDLGVPTQP